MDAPSSLTAAITGVVHAIKWQLQHRYLTLETITGLADDAGVALPNVLTKAA
ncbi:MAG: hypothetical protein ABTQ28_07960 [Thauera sp.]